MALYNISVGRTVKRNTVQEEDFESFADFCNYLDKSTVRLNITREEYRDLSKDESNELKQKIPFWTGATFQNGERKKAELSMRGYFTGDLDHAPKNWKALLKKSLKGIPYIVHTSVSHDPEEGKFKLRLTIPLSESVHEASVYHRLANYIMEKIQSKHGYFDEPTSIDPARAMFLPAKIKGDKHYEFIIENEDCEPFDLDQVPDLYEKLDDENAVHTYRDPATLDGVIGAFCSIYTARDVMTKYSGDDYAPSPGESDRWYYKLGTGTTAIRFYMDDKLLHSDHASDPLNRSAEGHRQWNAFELYSFFVHNGNDRKAKRALEDDPKVMQYLDDEFENIESELNMIIDEVKDEYLLPSSFKDMIANLDPHSMMAYLLPRVGKIMEGDKAKLVLTEIHPDRPGRVLYKTFVPTELAKLLSGIPEIPIVLAGKRGRGTEHVIFSVDRRIPPEHMYNGLGFEPSPVGHEKPRTWDSRLNKFRGFPITPHELGKKNPAYKKPEEFIHYVKDILCRGDKEKFRWTMDWLAQIFQEPQSKPNTCLALVSNEKGTGKSTLIEKVMSNLLEDMSVMVNGDRINSRFNSYLEGKLILGLDDLDTHGWKNSGVLRNMITQEDILIEKKGVDSYDAVHYARLIITSNNFRFLDLGYEDGMDRRFTVLEVSTEYRQNGKFWKKFNKWISKKENLINIMTYLTERKITSDLQSALITTTTREMSVHSMDLFDEWFYHERMELIDLLGEQGDKLDEMDDEDILDIQPEGFITVRNNHVYYNRLEIIERIIREHRGVKKASVVASINRSLLVDKYGLKIKSNSDVTPRGAVLKYDGKALRTIGIPLTCLVEE